MGTGQEVDDDDLIKSLLRCYEYKRRARKQVFHNKTFYKHMMKVHIMRQDIRKEIDSIHEQQRLEEQLREERRQLELQQEQQQIEYQQQLEFQQYQNQQVAFEQQQQQQEFAFQQQQQQQQQQQHQVQHSGYQIVQNQMPHQLTGYQDHYQFQYQQAESQQQFQVQQNYQTPMNYMEYSHDYGYEETSVKVEQRISSLESLETPPPSDLPSHPPPSLSSISSSSFTDSTTATLSSMYNIFGAPTETLTTSSADQASIRDSRTSSGFGSSGGSSQSPKNAFSPSNQLTLKFPMQLPQSAAADVDIMRRNLWLMIVRKEIPQARKRKMSFKDQKRSKAKTAAHRCVGHIKEFRRRLAIKAEKMGKLQAIVD